MVGEGVFRYKVQISGVIWHRSSVSVLLDAETIERGMSGLAGPTEALDLEVNGVRQVQHW